MVGVCGHCGEAVAGVPGESVHCHRSGMQQSRGAEGLSG